MEEAGTTWLRPATELEILFNEAHKQGWYVSSYALTLNTAAPLTEHHVREATTHLYRKVPNLRVCFRIRDNILWACQMDHEQIDFQVVKECDPVKVMEELLCSRFKSSEGPLWYARLLPPGSSYNPLSLPDFPHTSSFVFANHHAIADGTTNVRTVNLFLQILDDVVAGKNIDDDQQLGEHVTGEEMTALVVAKQTGLENNPERLQLLMKTKKEHEEAEKLLPRAFPQPRDVNCKTNIIPATLDTDSTCKFFHKCKTEGVSVNSAFVALLNVSLVDLVSEAGLKQETYLVRQMHAVNTRRYWSGDTSRALGVHISGIPNCTITPAKWRDNFWGYAKDIHQILHKGLQDQIPIEYICLCLSGLGDVTEDAMFSQRPLPEHDYDTANMGNLDKLMQTEGNHVRLTNLIRSTSNWNTPVTHMCQTLRGRFLYNMCYSSDMYTEERAQRFVSIMFENLKAMI